MSVLRVAAVAFRSEFGEPDLNLQKLLAWIEKAGDQGARLVCFPETALHGYCTCPDTIEKLAEPIGGSRMATIAAAAKAHDVAVGVGMALRDGNKIYNSMVFIGPHGFIGAQHKMHLCGADHAYDPGERWQVFDVLGWRVGAPICFDCDFPESVRVLALQGADLIVMPFASGRRSSAGKRAEPGDWAQEVSRWTPARAFDNKVFVVGVNHGGAVRDPHGRALANPYGKPDVEEWAPAGSLHQWTGYCFVLDPEGRLVIEANPQCHEQNMVIADLDSDALERSRTSMDVKGPAGMICGDCLAVRRYDTFARLVEPGGRGA